MGQELGSQDDHAGFLRLGGEQQDFIRASQPVTGGRWSLGGASFLGHRKAQRGNQLEVVHRQCWGGGQAGHRHKSHAEERQDQGGARKLPGTRSIAGIQTPRGKVRAGVIRGHFTQQAVLESSFGKWEVFR